MKTYNSIIVQTFLQTMLARDIHLSMTCFKKNGVFLNIDQNFVCLYERDREREGGREGERGEGVREGGRERVHHPDTSCRWVNVFLLPFSFLYHPVFPLPYFYVLWVFYTNCIFLAW